jgi:hypothetical protein
MKYKPKINLGEIVSKEKAVKRVEELYDAYDLFAKHCKLSESEGSLEEPEVELEISKDTQDNYILRASSHYPIKELLISTSRLTVGIECENTRMVGSNYATTIHLDKLIEQGLRLTIAEYKYKLNIGERK